MLKTDPTDRSVKFELEPEKLRQMLSCKEAHLTLFAMTIKKVGLSRQFVEACDAECFMATVIFWGKYIQRLD